MSENHTNNDDASLRMRNLQVHLKVSPELYADLWAAPGTCARIDCGIWRI